MNSYLEIIGGKSLSGEVEISGSKNAALPILAAAMIAEGEHHFSNVPEIEDIKLMIEALTLCGVKHKRTGSSLKLDTSTSITSQIPQDLTKRFRGGLYLLSSLLARTGRVSLGLPGGCNFDRPFDYHLSGLRSLGASFDVDNEGILGQVSRLRGTSVSLPFPSLGATCNLIIAACLAEGTTRIVNSSQAPEVIDLCHYLKMMGARITGVGTRSVIITGVRKLAPSKHAMMADRVEAATFLFAAAMTAGCVTIRNCPMVLVQPIADLLKTSGVRLKETDEGLQVVGRNRNEFVKFHLVIGPDPHFWTDWQPHVTALASLCNGESVIRDMYYFGRRFSYVNELKRLGAEIEVLGNVMRIRGPVTFLGRDVIATDIQGGISVVLAGLVARGITRVFGLDKIDRGYMGLEYKLSQLGAMVVKKSEGPRSSGHRAC